MKTPVIFLVDKNPIHRNLIRYNLELCKYTDIHTFPSGEECIYRLEKGIRPDFLITSFFTGNHLGFKFLQIIGELSPSTQVIFFDAFDDPLLARRLLEAGARDCVVKTRNPDAGISELLKNVRYLSKENLSREANRASRV